MVPVTLTNARFNAFVHHATLEVEKQKTSTKDLNEEELKLRVQRAIKRLDEAPKEKQREVFSNLLQFIEIHATKIKLGVYATNENSNDDEGGTESSQRKATGGSTAASGLLGASNVISILEGQKNQHRSKSTVGSRTFKDGGESVSLSTNRQAREITSLSREQNFIGSNWKQGHSSFIFGNERTFDSVSIGILYPRRSVVPRSSIPAFLR